MIKSVKYAIIFWTNYLPLMFGTVINVNIQRLSPKLLAILKLPFMIIIMWMIIITAMLSVFANKCHSNYWAVPSHKPSYSTKVVQ